MSEPTLTSLTINKGTCYAVFAYDIGWSIDLDDVNRRITADRERSRLRHKTRAPQYFTDLRRCASCRKEEASQSANINPALQSK